jgi:D-glycero-D-manno-heptose 1,7-bisphosphate phosphatase
MLTEAAQRFGVDLRQAVTIGDSDRDLRAGESAGVRAILVLTGKGARERETSQARLGDALEVVADLTAAVDRLLGSDPD